MERDLGSFIRTAKRMLGLGPKAPYKPHPLIAQHPQEDRPLKKPRGVTPAKINEQVTTNVIPDVSPSHQWPEVKINPNEIKNRKN